MNFKERYSYNSQSDLLGVGGFSTIFLATDNLLGRKVALKFFPVESGKKYSVLAEIRRVINLDHPNIARFHDAVVLENINVHGEIDKIEIGVMEYMDGGDLKHFLSHNHCDPNQIGKLLYDILLGLEYLHEHGIIHRDLKPQNVLVKNTPKGPVAKLTDFGISKASDAGTQTASTLLGSIEYMAPEQFNPAKFGIAGKIGTNVDLWGFGIMTYEILSGVALFGNRSSGQTTERVMNNILQREITETDIAHLPDPWRSVIRVCIIKNANTRARTAHDLRMIIEQSMNSSAPPTQFTSTGTTHNRNVPPPSNQTQVIGSQNVHERQHVVNNPVHPHAPPLVQAKQQSGPPFQSQSYQIKTEVVQHKSAGNHRSSTLSGSGQYVPPPSIQKKNIPVWVIIAGGCVLIALICLVAYLALRPEIAESVYEAEKQYEENKEDGLSSLRYLASSGNDSAYQSLADIYYSEGQYDSAGYYFEYVGNSSNPRSTYYLMMLNVDERLGREENLLAAVRYAWLGDSEGMPECTAYLEEFCMLNNVVIDQDYNFYDVMTFGTQRWMVDNLQTSFFQNGDIIREVKNRMEWLDAVENGEPAWCYYNYDASMGYGKLYNYYAIIDSRKLAPVGWKIPSEADWDALFDNGIGADNFLPGGQISGTSGCKGLSEWGVWWSSSYDNDALPLTIRVEGIEWNESCIHSNLISGYSVWCIKE